MTLAMELIIKEMKDRGLSQRWVARKSGVSHFTINKWTTDPPQDAKWLHVVKVGRVLNLPLDYLATGRRRDYRLREHYIQQWLDIVIDLERDQIYEYIGVMRLFIANKVLTPAHKNTPDQDKDDEEDERFSTFGGAV